MNSLCLSDGSSDGQSSAAVNPTSNTVSISLLFSILPKAQFNLGTLLSKGVDLLLKLANFPITCGSIPVMIPIRNFPNGVFQFLERTRVITEYTHA